MVKGTKNNGETATQVAHARSAEVEEKPQRRRFTAEYKADILRRTDAVELGSGELGEILRKEALYSSHLLSWRKQRDRGALDGLEPKRRGRKPKRRDAVALENERLRRENEQLQNRLKQAEVIIEVQKKVSELLGIPLAKLDDENGRNE